MTEHINQNNDFDLFSDILETLRLKGSIFFHSKMASPWGMSLSGQGLSRFHIALEGDCYIGLNTDEMVYLKHMDFVMLPNSDKHWIADKPDRKLEDSEDAASACFLGKPLFQEGEITNRLMCGLVSFDQNISHPIIQSLPNIIHFKYANVKQTAWVTAKLIDSEIQRTKNNSGPIIDRLTEVLLLQLLINYFDNCEGETGFVAATRDPRLRHALKLIHQYPEINWSLKELGLTIGMSRATLIRHFQNTIGVSPNSYMQNWKMLKAYNLVKYSTISLENISEQLGFSSSRTLAKAFKRHHGSTPAKLRSSGNF